MGVNTHIYLDDETKNLLNNIRKIEPNFVLSNFVRGKILEYHGNLLEKTLDISYIKERLKNVEIDENKIIKQSNYFRDLLKQAKNKKYKKEITEKNNKKMQESKKEERIQSFINSMKNYYEINGTKKIRKLAERFGENSNELTLFDFMLEEGYKERDIKRVDNIEIK